MLDIAICEDDRYQQGELEEKLYAMGEEAWDLPGGLRL